SSLRPCPHLWQLLDRQSGVRVSLRHRHLGRWLRLGGLFAKVLHMVTADIRTLYHLTFSPIRGTTHAARLQSFYGGQAAGYDAFRQRLLPGREELIRLLDFPEGGVWYDVGGGTGANVEFAGERLQRIARMHIVDLCPALLEIADRRIRQNGWNNAST